MKLGARSGFRKKAEAGARARPFGAALSRDTATKYSAAHAELNAGRPAGLVLAPLTRTAVLVGCAAVGDGDCRAILRCPGCMKLRHETKQ